MSRIRTRSRALWFHPNEDHIIRKAAEIEGRTVSCFIRHYTVIAARKILADLVKEPTK